MNDLIGKRVRVIQYYNLWEGREGTVVAYDKGQYLVGGLDEAEDFCPPFNREDLEVIEDEA